MEHIRIFENFDGKDDLERLLQVEFLDGKYRRALSGETSVDWPHGDAIVGTGMFLKTGTGREFEVRVKSLDDERLTIRYRMVHPFHQPPLGENVFFRARRIGISVAVLNQNTSSHTARRSVLCAVPTGRTGGLKNTVVNNILT